MKKTLVVKTDGGARGNPGPAAIGVFIKDKSTNKILYEEGKYIGSATNNVAEYTAVIEALAWLIKNKKILEPNYDRVELMSDSALIVNQLNGLYKIKNANLQMLSLKVKTLEMQLFAPIKYFHIRREHNTQPDKILNKALDQFNR